MAQLSNFEKARKQVPGCCLGFDAFQHKTISDLVFMVQHEIDLYDEGETTDIEDRDDLRQCRAFVARWRGITESDALGREEKKAMNQTAAVTMAGTASERLGVELIEIPEDRYQMHASLHDYVMLCHGCGKFHAVRAYFISTPLAIQFKFEDGSLLNCPASGCKTCMVDPTRPIRKAFFDGMTREAYNAAAQHLGAKGRP